MIVNEVRCKTILSKSGLYGIDYSLNPYRGCSHNCAYCYAPDILREQRKWGEFLDVKTNAPEVLSKELRRIKKGSVFLSSVTDPYQPLEKRFQLTRKVLEKFIGSDLFISILTKSSLVTRDIDLFKKLKCEVGITITNLNGRDQKIFEPNSSSTEERFKALRKLKDNEIKTYVFFGPILPFFSDRNLETFLQRVSQLTDCVMVDRLNLKKSTWPKIKNILEKNYPELIPKYEEIFFSKNGYYQELKEKITNLCKELSLEYEFCY